MKKRSKTVRRARNIQDEAAVSRRAAAQALARAVREQRRIRDLSRALDRAIDAADRATYAVAVMITTRRDALLRARGGSEGSSGQGPSLRQAVS